MTATDETAPGAVTADPLAVLEEIRQRERAATPGPWGWYGNADTQDIALATRKFGRCWVMRFTRWGMRNAQPLFAEGRKWGPCREYPDETIITPHGRMTPAKDLPVFEVAPAAVSRDDERVYRGDLVGVRNPDAEFIAAARDDVARLLRVAETLRNLCRDTDGNWLEPSSSLPVGEFQAALSLLAEEVPAS